MTPAYVTIIGYSGTAYEIVGPLANGSRETGPAVRKCGIRRRLGNPPHLCHGQEDKNLILSGHRCRHMCVSAQQDTRTHELKRLRTVRSQRNADRDLRHHHSVPQPIATFFKFIFACRSPFCRLYHDFKDTLYTTSEKTIDLPLQIYL